MITRCSKQFGRSDIWGATYGGISHRDECNAFPDPLKAGCYWRFDWFRNADNPTVTWEKTSCPEALSIGSNCRRNDDPVPGKNTPTPTRSAPISSGTVVQGGQCGGRRYTGPTVCVGGTVCTFVSEDNYYCLPDPASTRTTPTTTTHTPLPTVAQPWDQCGGRTYTGPTRCQNSRCVYYDEWWSQCHPFDVTVTNAPRPTTTQRQSQGPPPRSTWPGWSFSRPGTPAQTSRAPSNPGGQPTLGQLYDQCGGRGFGGNVQCTQGLYCKASHYSTLHLAHPITDMIRYSMSTTAHARSQVRIKSSTFGSLLSGSTFSSIIRTTANITSRRVCCFKRFATLEIATGLWRCLGI